MKKIKALITAADSGNKEETLRSLRHKIAETIQKSESGRDIAALSRQLREVMDELENLNCSKAIREENITVLELVRQKHKKEA